MPRPSHWSGFRVKPQHIEFWKAHPFRLHWLDVYEKRGDVWATGQLFP